MEQEVPIIPELISCLFLFIDQFVHMRRGGGEWHEPLSEYLQRFPSFHDGFQGVLTAVMAMENNWDLVDTFAMAVKRPEELQRRAIRARDRLSAYSPRIVVEQYLDVFDRVTAQTPVNVNPVSDERDEDGQLLPPLTHTFNILSLSPFGSCVKCEPN